jgi:hypothetical protein
MTTTPAIDVDKTRAEFEAAMIAKHYQRDLFERFRAEDDWAYYSMQANAMFDAWQAARALPQQVEAGSIEADTEFCTLLLQYRETDFNSAAKRAELIAYIDARKAAPGSAEGEGQGDD